MQWVIEHSLKCRKTFASILYAKKKLKFSENFEYIYQLNTQQKIQSNNNITYMDLDICRFVFSSNVWYWQHKIGYNYYCLMVDRWQTNDWNSCNSLVESLIAIQFTVHSLEIEQQPIKIDFPRRWHKRSLEDILNSFQFDCDCVRTERQRASEIDKKIIIIICVTLRNGYDLIVAVAYFFRFSVVFWFHNIRV